MSKPFRVTDPGPAGHRTREDLSDPYRHMTHREKMIASKAIDLRDNSREEDLGNGYSILHPIDRTKIITEETED